MFGAPKAIDEDSDNAIIGAIVCKIDTVKGRLRGYIAMLAVREDYRKQGLGMFMFLVGLHVLEQVGNVVSVELGAHHVPDCGWFASGAGSRLVTLGIESMKAAGAAEVPPCCCVVVVVLAADVVLMGGGGLWGAGRPGDRGVQQGCSCPVRESGLLPGQAIASILHEWK